MKHSASKEEPRRAWDAFSEMEGAVSDAARLACALAMANYGGHSLGVDENHQEEALQALAVEVMHAARRANDLWFEAHALFVAEKSEATPAPIDTRLQDRAFKPHVV